MLDIHSRRRACETRRKRHFAVLVALAFTLGLLAWSAAPLRAQEHEAASGASGEGAHHEAEEHGGSVIDVVARLVNFGILAGTLVYFLRSPLRTYLVDRSTAIRTELITAVETKQAAAAQIAEIDRKMQALPGELDALRAQGTAEIAAEATRIQTAAAAERDRLLEQARREIDLQVKVAERDLLNRAADQAVGLAADRIKNTITDTDQQRLVDRYVGSLPRA
jgi:F-type H+-transporting ATPase subunit b